MPSNTRTTPSTTSVSHRLSERRAPPARSNAYVYDGDNLAMDFALANGTWTLAKSYLSGNAVDHVFAEEDLTQQVTDPARVLWMVDDNEGSTRWLLNNAAGVATHYTYTPYGQASTGNTSLTPFLYAGGFFDVLSGLQYNDAEGGGRWYHPVLGRWLQQDPIGFGGGDYNLSRYVGNDPTDATDPSGLADDSLGNGLTRRVDTRGNPFGGFEVHVYRGDAEIAKNGAGGWAATHSDSEF